MNYTVCQSQGVMSNKTRKWALDANKKKAFHRLFPPFSVILLWTSSWMTPCGFYLRLLLVKRTALGDENCTGPVPWALVVGGEWEVRSNSALLAVGQLNSVLPELQQLLGRSWFPLFSCVMDLSNKGLHIISLFIFIVTFSNSLEKIQQLSYKYK